MFGVLRLRQRLPTLQNLKKDERRISSSRNRTFRRHESVLYNSSLPRDDIRRKEKKRENVNASELRKKVENEIGNLLY